MRYLYLTNPPVSGIFVKRIPMRKKSAKPEALPAQAEVTTATANEAPVAAALDVHSIQVWEMAVPVMASTSIVLPVCLT